jgi:hypothetical protein
LLSKKRLFDQFVIRNIQRLSFNMRLCWHMFCIKWPTLKYIRFLQLAFFLTKTNVWIRPLDFTRIHPFTRIHRPVPAQFLYKIHFRTWFLVENCAFYVKHEKITKFACWLFFKMFMDITYVIQNMFILSDAFQRSLLITQ